jgi:hypothetical protein
MMRHVSDVSWKRIGAPHPEERHFLWVKSRMACGPESRPALPGSLVFAVSPLKILLSILLAAALE